MSTDVKTGWLVFSSRARPESNELFLGAAEVVSLLGFCCDQPEKGCQELPQIDCEHFYALGKRQALVHFFFPSHILPLSPMATLLSAQMAQSSEKVSVTGHSSG
jgi:hypothetical protein